MYYENNWRESSNLVRLREEESKKEFDEIENLDIESQNSFNEKCKKILEIDDALRFAGICTEDGKILASEYKKGIDPAYNDIEKNFLASQLPFSGSEHNDFREKFGKLMYSVLSFENLKRATFALDSGTLLISFDKTADENKIINKVIYDVGLG